MTCTSLQGRGLAGRQTGRLGARWQCSCCGRTHGPHGQERGHDKLLGRQAVQQQALQGAELQGVEDTRVKQAVRAGMHSSSQAQAQHAQHAQHARHGLADPEIDDHYDEAQRHPDAPKHVGGVDDDAGGACMHACMQGH